MTAVVSRTDPRLDAALQGALDLGEVGIQVAAYLNGELLVEGVVGVADPATGRAVDSSTLFCPFSMTKGVVAIALHLQCERGLVDYDAPVAEYWPEFAQAGKSAITVRQAINHQAGLPWMPDDVTAEQQADWDSMIGSLERMTPAFPAGTNAYHALTWGWLIGEIVSRTDPRRRRIDEFLREEVLEPIGATDTHLLLPESEYPRLATLVGEEIPASEPLPNYFRGMPKAVYPAPSVFNTELSLRTVNPAGGLRTTARSAARVFALLACRGELDGVRLLSEERVFSLFAPRENSAEPDRYLGGVLASGNGYYLSGSDGGFTGMMPLIPMYRSVLWAPGAGGSVGWAEVDTGLSVAICHNRMRTVFDPDNHPYLPIAEAIREIAAEQN